MKKVKSFSNPFKVLLVISYLLALTYVLMFIPSTSKEIYGGNMPPEFYAYGALSGLVYTGSLVGVTLRKRFATYPFVGIILLDAAVLSIFTNSLDITLNLILAAVWVLALNLNFKLFKLQ